MIRLSRLAASALLIAAAAGCHHDYQPRQPLMPYVPTTITSLPFDNATASIDAPKIFRAQLHPRLGRKGYILQNMGDTDTRIKAMGIQLGGQMKGVDPKELHEKLGTDLAVWGTIYTATSLVTGVYNRRTVEAEIIITDLRTGEVIWKDRQKIWNDSNTGARKDVIGGLLTGVVDGAVKADMTAEHMKLADVLVNRMPWCPRQPPPPPPPDPAAVSSTGAPAPAPTPAPK